MEILNSGFDGWVGYVDADAFIVNLNFDIFSYLNPKSDKSIIIPRSRVNDDLYWEINDGIFFINFSNQTSAKIVKNWYEEFMAISDRDLERCEDWVGIENDQDLLQKVLMNNPEFAAYVEHDNVNIYGADSKFIRQILRVDAPTYQQRLRIIESLAFAVLERDGQGESVITHGGLARQAFDQACITALYEVLLLRKADDFGLAENLKSFINSGRDLPRIMKSFIKSDEFKANFSNFCEVYNIDNPHSLTERG